MKNLKEQLLKLRCKCLLSAIRNPNTLFFTKINMHFLFLGRQKQLDWSCSNMFLIESQSENKRYTSKSKVEVEFYEICMSHLCTSVAACSTTTLLLRAAKHTKAFRSWVEDKHMFLQASFSKKYSSVRKERNLLFVN